MRRISWFDNRQNGRKSMCVGGLVVTAVLLALSGSAHATNYYIDNATGSGCSDSGAHSIAQPWCNASKINGTTFAAGDNIYLHINDTWTLSHSITLSGSGSSASGAITLTSYGGTGNKPKITYATSASDQQVIYGTNISYWTISGLEIQDNSTIAFDHTNTAALTLAIYLYYTGTGPYSNITITNNDLHGVGMTHNNFLVVVQANYPSGLSTPAIPNLTITDNTIHDAGQGLVWILGNQALYSGTLEPAFSNLLFRGNTLYNSYVQGANFMVMTSGKIEDNIIHHTAQYTGGFPSGVAGLWLIACKDSTVDNNEAYDNSDAGNGDDGAGVDVDWYNHNITVESNYFHDNKGPGIEVLQNDSTSLLYNRVANNQAATTVGSGQIGLNGFSGGLSSINSGISNANISGNVIVLNASGSVALTTADQTLSTWSGNSFTGNYDLFVGSSSEYNLETNGYGLMSTVTGNSFYSSSGTSFSGTLNGTTKSSLADWVTFTGYDIGSGQEVGTSVSQAKADFTPSGHTSNKWTYYYSTDGESTFNATTWDEADQWWSGNEAYCLIAAGWAQPGGTSCDTVLTWAPASAGTAEIGADGDTISVAAGCGGSGVQVRILKNTTQIWPSSGWQAIANGGSYTFSVMTTTVAATDKIRFVIAHAGSNNNCDAVTWAPWIIFH